MLGLDVPGGHNQVWQRCDIKGNPKSRGPDENPAIIPDKLSFFKDLQMLPKGAEVDTAAFCSDRITLPFTVCSIQDLRVRRRRAYDAG